MSWKNDTDATQTYTIGFTTGLTVTAGTGVNNGFSVSNAYAGMSVTIEHQQKVFKTTETTDTKSITITVTIPPKSLLAFYQRRYLFRNSMSFILDAWDKQWNVGSWGGYDICKKECSVEIMSEDYATLRSELDGSRTGTMEVQRVSGVQIAGTTRKRENCTEKCKNKLNDIL